MQLNKITRTKCLIALVLVFDLTMAAMCGSGSDPARTLAKATDDFAEGQKSAANLLLNAKSTNLVSQEDINEIKPFLQEANSLNGEAIALGKELLANPTDQTKKERLVATVNLISAALVRANNAGLTRIRDEKTKLAFSAIIAALQAAATSAIVLLKKG